MTVKKRNFDFGIIIGLAIVLAGLLLLLERLDVGVDIRLGDYWPVLIILIGVAKLLQPGYSRQIFWGLTLVGIGTLFQLNNLDIIDFWFDDLWPIAIILVGIVIIKGSSWRPKFLVINARDKGSDDSCCGSFSHKKESIDGDQVNISATLGGGEYKISSKHFKGGNVSATLGGCEVDFRDAEIDGDSAVINASALMGGVELYIPPHWQVEVHASPILGAVENKATIPKESTKKLVVRGSAVMGAIEIKN